MSTWENIEAALVAGAKLHAFRSGGGLRVVRIESEGKLIGYGEHPSFEDALVLADKDIAAGGRPYAEVYGKETPEYLTGSSTPSSELDRWILGGQTIDAFLAVDTVIVELHGWEHSEAPPDIMARVRAGNTVEWGHRGYVFESSPSRFPNGDPCVTTSIISHPPGRDKNVDPWMYQVVKTGTGDSLQEAFDAALEAEPEEPAGSRPCCPFPEARAAG